MAAGAKQISRSKMKSRADDPLGNQIADDIDRYASLQLVGQSDGGKLLIASLKSDIFAAVWEIADDAGKLTLQQFVTLGCSIKERLTLIHTLSRSGKNERLARKALAEHLQKIGEEENEDED